MRHDSLGSSTVQAVSKQPGDSQEDCPYGPESPRGILSELATHVSLKRAIYHKIIINGLIRYFSGAAAAGATSDSDLTVGSAILCTHLVPARPDFRYKPSAGQEKSEAQRAAWPRQRKTVT